MNKIRLFQSMLGIESNALPIKRSLLVCNHGSKQIQVNELMCISGFFRNRVSGVQFHLKEIFYVGKELEPAMAGSIILDHN